MAPPGDPPGETRHSCPRRSTPYIAVPSFAPGEYVELCASGVKEDGSSSEAFTAADKDGGLYVVISGTDEVVVGPDFANFAQWRALCNEEAVFESRGYSGMEDIDRQVLTLPPDAL